MERVASITEVTGFSVAAISHRPRQQVARTKFGVRNSSEKKVRPAWRRPRRFGELIRRRPKPTRMLRATLAVVAAPLVAAAPAGADTFVRDPGDRETRVICAFPDVCKTGILYNVHAGLGLNPASP